MAKILILILINCLTLIYNYSISLNYPFLISSRSAISYMKNDLNGNYFIQLQNRTVIKYNPNLTTYQIIPYPQNIEKMGHSNKSLFVRLQNGTSFLSPGLYQSVIYNNFTSINFHDYTTYKVLSSYHLNDTIINNFGYALYVANTTATPHSIVVCKSTLNFIYQSQIYTVYNYSTIFGNNITAISAQFSLKFNGSTVLGFQNITYNFYISTSNNKIYYFTLTINLLFNEATQMLDYYSMASNYTLLATFNQTIIKMIFNSYANVIIMQSVSSNYYFYNLGTNQFGRGSANLSSFVMHQLFNNSNNLYILCTTGLIQINLPTNSSNSLVLLAVVDLLPLNNYELVLGNIDLLYIISGSNIYKAGPCLGQLQQLNSTCISYNCTINCSSCPFNSQTCTTCNQGTIRNQSFLCNFNYSTNFSLANQTNLTDQIDISNFNFDYVISDFLQQFLNYLLTFLSAVISVPGARAVITPIFYLFGNFDNLFLYQFHDRKYNSVVNDFFNKLNNLETEKWNLVNTTDMISHIGDVQYFYNLTNFQSSYQQFNYLHNTLKAGQSQGLFYNSQNYFIGVLPTIFAYFCIFHGLFRVLYQNSISKIFRNYQFWLFLFLIQFDGNVQQLTFYLSREWISMCYFSFPQKLFKISIIYYGFVLIFASCSAYYLFRWFYKLKIRLMLDNCRIGAMSIFCITVEFGIKNICFGAINFFGRYLSYSALIEILILSQFIVVMFSILLLRTNLYKNMTKTWLLALLSFLRILFILSLLFDHQNQNAIIQRIQLVLIVLMILVFFIGMVLGFTINFKEYAAFFIKNCNNQHEILQIRTNIKSENKVILDNRQFQGDIIKKESKSSKILKINKKTDNSQLKL